MVLRLSAYHLEAIRQHGESTYPNECCGLLLGKSNDSKTVVEVRATQNVWNAETAELFSAVEGMRASNQLSTYAICPHTILQVQKEVRDRALQIVGIYHSHPNHPAIASECDRAFAWEQYSYIIVSVVQGKAKELLSWQLDSERQFQAEEIIIDNLI